MNKAIFFDRDGVINEDLGYVHHQKNFYFKKDIFEFCRKANDAGYLLFIVTNQAGIARGYYTEKEYQVLTEWMLEKFLEQKIQITKVYFCPYHPTDGIGNYKQESFYRKPAPGMLLQAKQEYHVDLSKSILIGDKESDIEAGRKAGIKKLFFLHGKYELKENTNAIVISNILNVIDYL